MQIALLEWAELVQVGQHTLADWLAHIPNGAARSPVEASILKAMGTKAGMPDLILPIRTPHYGSVYWELKADNGKPSGAQLERHAMLRVGGAYVNIARRWDDAGRDMLRYLERGPFTVVVRAPL